MMKIQRHTSAGPKYRRGPFLTAALSDKHRRLVIELSPDYLTVREIGRRRGLQMTYAMLWLQASLLEARAQQRQRNADRKAKREQRTLGKVGAA